MAANNPRWRPKKCQPEFLINLWSIVTKKLGWQKLTQNFHDITQQHILYPLEHSQDNHEEVESI